MCLKIDKLEGLPPMLKMMFSADHPDCTKRAHSKEACSKQECYSVMFPGQECRAVGKTDVNGKAIVCPYLH